MSQPLTSGITPFQPSQVIDMITGEIIPDWEQPVRSLLSYIQIQTQLVVQNGGETLLTQVSTWAGSPSPAEYGRQQGITWMTPPSQEVKVKSRVERLLRHKIITELVAHTRNLNPHKQAPTHSLKINLGAVDKAMCVLSYADGELALEWKVWDQYYLFMFNVPDYVLKRDILKWCLPTVQESKKTGRIVFGFAYQEQPSPVPKTKIKAGVDLGRVEPFTIAVLNEKQNLIARYTASPRLKQLNNKRERLLVERKQIRTKLSQHDALQVNTEKTERLRVEATRKRDKITRLGTNIAHDMSHEIVKKLRKHEVSLFVMEDLRFVTGTKGGRWNHSRQTEAITHAVKRAGMIPKKTRAAGTSQHCHACGTRITHDTKRRVVRCSSCQSSLDRDFNATLNIVKQQSYPTAKRSNGDTHSPTGHSIDNTIMGAVTRLTT